MPNGSNIPAHYRLLNILLDLKTERSGHSDSELNFRCEDEDAFNLDALAGSIANVGSMRHLTISDVDISCAEGNFNHEFRVDNLSLHYQNEEFRQGFLTATSGSPLCYCHLDGAYITYESVPMAHYLRLENIYVNGDAAFSRALKRHFGNRSDIIDCEGFADDHLQIIGTHCELLQRPYLIDCPNFAVKGLKVMVTERLKLVST
ncbi:unnamed protein product [Cyclocybe aegerita]|uniref:Uncharacterized protein n=1 Tax=Cyclocybe aegerita TaxID=1973307 RepID=A0A8S0X974_CYCAE|nr:unnamed protein product [Cyclocybe aegerita]